MSVILGNAGNVLLRRHNSITWQSTVTSDDINMFLNRLGVVGTTDNILQGDRVVISTDDPRGLIFFPNSMWSSDEPEQSAAPYVSINAAGGLRFFDTFQQALTNDRQYEIPLSTFTGDPIVVNLTVRDTIYNSLANVESFTFYSDRNSIDTTELGSKFKQMYDAGLLTGSGTLNCLFQHTREEIELSDYEEPIVLMQLLQRIDLGSRFAANLFLSDKDRGGGQNVFYNIDAVITRSGIDVRSDKITRVSIDFVTTGEYRLLFGDPLAYILKEDDFFIEKEKGLGFLLKEETD